MAYLRGQGGGTWLGVVPSYSEKLLHTATCGTWLDSRRNLTPVQAMEDPDTACSSTKKGERKKQPRTFPAHIPEVRYHDGEGPVSLCHLFKSQMVVELLAGLCQVT